MLTAASPATMRSNRSGEEARERLPEYDFLDGDRDFIRRLARGQM